MAEYPATLPTFTDPTATSKLNSPSHSDLHAQANAEIVAITTELGTDPAGSFSTVKARIAALETHVITNLTTGEALTINQSGVLANGEYGVQIYSNAIQVNNGSLLLVYQDNASSSSKVVMLSNDGTGTSLSIGHYNAASTKPAVAIYNYGTGNGLVINQYGTLSGANALRIVAQANQAVALVYLSQSGTGPGIQIANGGSGSSIDITSAVNSSGTLMGVFFNLVNDGAGLEYAFGFYGSEAVAGAVGGAQDKKIRVKVGTTDYFIPCYTT